MSQRLIAITLSVLLMAPMCAAHQQDRELDLWIGQMLMVGFRGTELGPDDPFLQQVRDLHLGGAILFDYDVASRSPVRNILSAEQVRALTASLQAAAGTPLFVAIDQEGGRLARLKEVRGFPATLSAAEMGRRNSEEITRKQAGEMGRLLAGLGINMNFAPVVDLAANPENPVIAGLERSYGADPELVAKHARWTIEAFHEAGIWAAVKHFPGHGSSRDDSHLGLPDVSETWSPVELAPFAELIEEELPDMVMTAHLYNSRWDSRYPATLSKPVISGILRQDLGFEGVIISDDMGMGAIVQNYTFEKAIELAINAGVDILLLGNNLTYDPDLARKAFDIVRGMVERGEISPERIRQSFQRISDLKSRRPSH
ncbi:MAG: glycoside hydrolase family 3 protein [Acidobacteriota bacterium]